MKATDIKCNFWQKQNVSEYTDAHYKTVVQHGEQLNQLSYFQPVKDTDPLLRLDV